MKPEMVMMSPPASDSGSGSPHQFSPYCVDSEPGSPLLDHEQVHAEVAGGAERAMDGQPWDVLHGGCVFGCWGVRLSIVIFACR